jgi:hypothetical protein
LNAINDNEKMKAKVMEQATKLCNESKSETETNQHEKTRVMKVKIILNPNNWKKNSKPTQTHSHGIPSKLYPWVRSFHGNLVLLE